MNVLLSQMSVRPYAVLISLTVITSIPSLIINDCAFVSYKVDTYHVNMTLLRRQPCERLTQPFQ